MPVIADEDHLAAARRIRRLVAVYRDHADVISVGAYRAGSDPLIDEAIAMREAIRAFILQHRDEPSDLPSACRALRELSLSAASRSVVATSG
jgi:flagellum-specific ATP synthase